MSSLNVNTAELIANNVQSLTVYERNLLCFASSFILMGTCKRLTRLTIVAHRLTKELLCHIFKTPSITSLTLRFLNVLNPSSISQVDITEIQNLSISLQQLNLQSQEENIHFVHLFTKCRNIKTLSLKHPINFDKSRNEYLWLLFSKSFPVLSLLKCNIVFGYPPPITKFKSISELCLRFTHAISLNYLISYTDIAISINHLIVHLPAVTIDHVYALISHSSKCYRISIYLHTLVQTCTVVPRAVVDACVHFFTNMPDVFLILRNIGLSVVFNRESSA